MVSIFEATADALANLLGTTSEIAGFILGAALIVTLVVAFYWVLGDRALSGVGIVLPMTIGFIFGAVFGWLPLWTVVFVALVVVLIVMNPFKAASGV